MKKFFVISAVIGAAALVSCQKQQTEAEKNAEVERQVQERLAAEHQSQQQQQQQQRQADLDAREKALAEKENATPATPNRAERSESETLESRPRPRAPQGAITTGYTTFYNKLEPYGDWIETGDYGYVFHPRQAESSRSWRPYTDGRWVYTDAGCTWISEEPFGWATYHYGRWTRLRGIGWVWVPGNQWAPAWVSWRKSTDYVGWAPLPPEARFDQRTGIHNWSDNYYDIGPDQYCFVASREFGAPRVQQTLLPPERSVTIINQTTNVTNITRLGRGRKSGRGEEDARKNEIRSRAATKCPVEEICKSPDNDQRDNSKHRDTATVDIHDGNRCADCRGGDNTCCNGGYNFDACFIRIGFTDRIATSRTFACPERDAIAADRVKYNAATHRCAFANRERHCSFNSDYRSASGIATCSGRLAARPNGAGKIQIAGTKIPTAKS